MADSSRRDQILGAAEALFADRGFAAPSLRDLLGAAGTSTTAFYARFDGKEAVLDALVDDLVADLGAAASRVVAETRDLDEGFRSGIDALIEVLLPRRGLVRVTLTEGMALDGVRDRMGALYTSLAAVLGAGLRAQGHPDPEAGGWVLVGTLAMQVTRWAVLGQLTDEALPDALARAAATPTGPRRPR